MGKWDKPPRCHSCSAAGKAKWDGYCKAHAPKIADCPKCGARGFPKYRNHCPRCWGVKDDDVNIFRENFFEDSRETNTLVPGEFGIVGRSFGKPMGE